MKFTKYSAIYRNDALDITGDSVTGTIKDIKEYLKYELASQCMSDVDYENLIDNFKMTIDLLEQLIEEDDDKKIIVKVHPMGGFYFEEVKGNE